MVIFKRYFCREHIVLDPGDGRRQDGMTSFPFKGGKALVWDAICNDYFSASNLYSDILNPCSASSAAEDLKRRKYSQLVADFEFVPVAVETCRDNRFSQMLPFS